MIVEWFMSLATQFTAWLVTVFPAWVVPEWFTDADGGFATIMSMANGMDAWVNMSLATGVVGSVLATWIVCLIIKIVLKAVGHVPGVGGNG